jgi:hypothetical protein
VIFFRKSGQARGDYLPSQTVAFTRTPTEPYAAWAAQRGGLRSRPLFQSGTGCSRPPIPRLRWGITSALSLRSADTTSLGRESLAREYVPLIRFVSVDVSQLSMFDPRI